MRVRIAHISDSHFGTEIPEVTLILQETLLKLSPDVILFSGDITQRARKSQFKAARVFLNAIAPIPVVVVPGNHDIPLFNVFDRIIGPYRNFKEHIHDKVESIFLLKEIQFLAFNSTEWVRHIQGKLKKSRIKEMLKDRPDSAKLRVACFHHPVVCAKEVDEKNLLKNRIEICNLLGEFKVDLVLGGHIHDPHVTVTEQGFVAAVAGTCMSHRVRKGAPNSFNLIECDTESLSLEIQRLDVVQSENRFHSVSKNLFRRLNGTWSQIS